MIGKLRGKVGSYIVGGVITFIALIFAFEGVFGPKATRGLHDGAVAGKVNGDPISIGDYNRALERKLEFLKGLTGGKVSEEQMKMFRVREGVFQEIVQQKLMAQAAMDSGRAPSDEAVRQEIMTLPYFQKEGKFDPATYRGVLEANHYSTGMFEKMIREQLAVEDWTKSFSSQVRVSETEAKEEYLLSKNQRTYKIVSIPASAPAAESAKGEKKGESLTPKAAAEKVAGLMKADKKSDDAVNAILKPFGVTVREIPDASQGSGFVAGATDHPELAKELFEENGLAVGKVKIYESPARISVVLVTAAKKPDLSKFDAEKGETESQLRTKKERELMNDVIKKLTDKAKIDPNPAVVGGDSESA